jgi:hypothetical protein
MATTASIPALLRNFAQKQGSELVAFAEFCDYIKRYAEHHIDEQPDLITFIGNSAEAVRREVSKLSDANRVVFIDSKPSPKIVMIEIIAEKIALKYTQAVENPQILFPCVTDLPKYFSNVVIPQQMAPSFFFDLLDNKKHDEHALFSIAWPKNIPAILYPSALAIETFLEAAVMKLHYLLQKEYAREFYLKKLMIANAGHEVIARNFFNQFFQHPKESLRLLKESGDAYYLWNQLCFYAKQDFEKEKDLTADDEAYLQAIYIIEFVSTYFKNKAQINAQRENALHTLASALERPPYYFSYQTITKLSDIKGAPLLGQYSEEELAVYLRDCSTVASNGGLPRLLTFKLESGLRYYIFKTNVILLLTRLLGDARESIRNTIVSNWEKALKSFTALPEMHDSAAFEKNLAKTLRSASPVLYALFNAPFLDLVQHEMQGTKGASSIMLFKNGIRLPYTEIFLFSRHELLNEAKSHVSFWYVTPPFSFILKMLFGAKTKKPHMPSAPALYSEDRDGDAEFAARQHSAQTQDPAVKRKDEIRTAARKLTDQFVPEGSDIDSELASYERQWNRLLDKTARQNLTEDVNSLIRDYLKTVVRTLRGATLDAGRIHGLAMTLADVNALKTITDHDQLFMYIKLYIIRLLSNVK